MPLIDFSLFESLTPKAAEAKAPRTFGVQPEARKGGREAGDFAGFLKAEQTAWSQTTGEMAETSIAPEYQFAASAEYLFELTREISPQPESAPETEPEAGDRPAAWPNGSGLAEADVFGPTEPAFPAPAPTEAEAPAAVPAPELPLFESARAAAPTVRPEAKPVAVRPEAWNGARLNRAAEPGEFQEAPRALAEPARFGQTPAATVTAVPTAGAGLASPQPAFAAPRPDQTLNLTPEEYKAPAAPAMGESRPAPVTAPVVSDGEDAFAARPEADAGAEPARFSQTPTAVATAGAGLASPRPAFKAFEAPRPDSSLTSRLEDYKAPAAPAPSAPPNMAAAPATAPGAGGDEFSARPEAEAGAEPARFGQIPAAVTTAVATAGAGLASPRPAFKAFEAPRPDSSLTSRLEEFKTPASPAPAAPAPMAAASRPAHTPAPTIAPSAGGEEDGFVAPPAAGADLVSQRPAFEAPRPDQALNLTLEEYEAPAAPSTTPPAPWLASTLNSGRSGRAGLGDWNSLASGILARKHLNLAAGQVAAPAFSEGADPAAVNAALDRARINWPTPFRKQVGLGLVALGRPGRSANSMAAGAGLLGSSSSGEVLRSVLSGLKGELKVLKLPPAARDNLGRILAGSGLDQTRLSRIMAGFGRDGMSLESLNKELAGLDLSGRGRSLTATESGLTELSRFLGSLGAPAEVIDRALNSLKPGQPVTGEILRDIFKNTELGGLARDLSPGDIKCLAAFLRGMGAGPQVLDSLENLLQQTSGQLPLESFLDFLDSLKEAPLEAVSGQEMEELKSLLDQVRRDDGLARTPVFNEILIKLEALGDPEIDDDFMNLSPALQALRGGISGAEDFSQFLGGRDRGHQDRENQERYREVVQAMATGQDGPAGASVMAAAEGYGGRSEALTRQIAQKIVLSRRRGLTRLKMNLNPAELGRLDIDLTVGVKDGALTARLRASSREAFAALAGRIEDLKRALAESGVSVAGLTLSHEDETLDLAELAAQARAEARKDRAGDLLVSQLI